MNNIKASLNVLLVAINEYPNPAHRLYGCENDVNDVESFLLANKQETHQLQIIKLLNKEATRKNVIKAFLNHLGSLKDGDTGLFYFCGHGARTAAASQFWHNTPSRKHESIVCYDSRLEGGKDLLDKELSWLIWKATAGKKIPLTLIMDCCHSGSIFRSEELLNRSAEDVEQSKALQNYLGFEDYLLHEDKVSVPSGRYIHLAACRDYETAKEKLIENKRRGVFTFSLIAALKKNKGNISLQQLKKTIQAQVYNQVDNQHPLIKFSEEDNKSYFLGGAFQEKIKWHLIYFHHGKGWIADVGTIHGLQQAEGQAPGKFQLFPEEEILTTLDAPGKLIREVKISAIYADFCTLEGLENEHPQSRFKGVFLQMVSPELKIAIEAEDPEGEQYLQKAFDDFGPSTFAWVEDRKEADYKIMIKNNRYTFYQRFGDLAFQPTLINYNEFSAKRVLHYLDQISHWHRIKSLRPTPAQHLDLECEVELYEVLSASQNYLHVIEERLVSDLSLVPLKYQAQGSKSWEEPMFRLKIKNPDSNKQRLWVTALYLGNNFSINNSLLPPTSLMPGEEVWMEVRDEVHKVYTNLIPVCVPDNYTQKGIYEITEHLKVIVSSEELDTMDLEQEGLALEQNVQSSMRNIGRNGTLSVPIAAWRVYDGVFKISRPRV